MSSPAQCMFLSVFTQYRTFLLSLSLLLSSLVCTGYAGDSRFPLRRVQQTELVVALGRAYPEAVEHPAIGVFFSGYFCPPTTVNTGALLHRCRLEHALLTKTVLRRSRDWIAHCYAPGMMQPLKTIPTSSDEAPLRG